MLWETSLTREIPGCPAPDGARIRTAGNAAASTLPPSYFHLHSRRARGNPAVHGGYGPLKHR